MRIGIYTFGDLRTNPVTGDAVGGPERMRQMLEMAKLADEAGLDLIGVGEHHGLDYVNSATATMLAAMAAVTKRIRLTSSTTLIATADPVRTFQEFATADLVSGGRIEIIVGRGAFNDNYPLFGNDMADYDALFVEKLGLLDLLNDSSRVTWKGRFRPPLHDAEIAPRPAQSRLPISIGALSAQTVQRAARAGYPLAMPMLGGRLDSYGETARHYREAFADHGRTKSGGPEIAVFGHAFVSDAGDAMAELYPYYSTYLAPLFNAPMPHAAFRDWSSPMGSLVAGSPQQVVEKLGVLHAFTGCSLFAGQIDIGAQPFAQVMRSIELLASQVAPAVRSLGEN